jgi:hypothetical protein
LQIAQNIAIKTKHRKDTFLIINFYLLTTL